VVVETKGKIECEKTQEGEREIESETVDLLAVGGRAGGREGKELVGVPPSQCEEWDVLRDFAIVLSGSL
jgi:hypothetical protein